jgi:hypothetical protein
MTCMPYNFQSQLMNELGRNASEGVFYVDNNATICWKQVELKL